MIIIHKQQCFQKEVTCNKTSPESHLHRRNVVHKNPLCLWIYADFEADIEKEDSKSTCNKTISIYKQIPIHKDYRIVSELEDVLKSG